MKPTPHDKENCVLLLLIPSSQHYAQISEQQQITHNSAISCKLKPLFFRVLETLRQLDQRIHLLETAS